MNGHPSLAVPKKVAQATAPRRACFLLIRSDSQQVLAPDKGLPTPDGVEPRVNFDSRPYSGRSIEIQSINLHLMSLGLIRGVNRQ